jgi:protocatechuate 3,4-dioxygenase, alpha subunit
MMTDRREDVITPAQTAGPFFAFCLTPAAYEYRQIFTNDLAADGVPGERIRIEGRVFDGEGQPVPDAMIEIWQADPSGRFATPKQSGSAAFKGFGRTECDADGRFRFTTLKPGAVPGPQGSRQAPHINVGIFARGLLRRLFTRMYFSDEIHNANDPVLALVPGDRSLTLIAHLSDTVSGPVYAFDIRLQGENETVFFEA